MTCYSQEDLSNLVGLIGVKIFVGSVKIERFSYHLFSHCSATVWHYLLDKVGWIRVQLGVFSI